ncbi:MAG: OadG family protein [Treponema sp.]|jgi:oxaloacetate decarboxylase gamma subunit|nr:OadG family protein [Treponema sp.]
MTVDAMLEQSGVLTLLGMGIVFFFLVILIVVVSLMGKLVQALEQDRDGRPLGGAAGLAAQAADHGAVTAAITAAVTEYRKTRV